MSKPTPGPWEWSGYDLDGGPHGSESVIESEVSCGTWCLGGQVRLSVSPSNAALLAAAPDLLDIAKRVSAWGDEHNIIGGETGRLVDDARAAIAKAAPPVERPAGGGA